MLIFTPQQSCLTLEKLNRLSKFYKLTSKLTEECSEREQICKGWLEMSLEKGENSLFPKGFYSTKGLPFFKSVNSQFFYSINSDFRTKYSSTI